MADYRGGGPNPGRIGRPSPDLTSRILEVLPEECWVLRGLGGREAKWLRCTDLTGGELNGATLTWTEEMCCLPCRIRKVLAEHG